MLENFPLMYEEFSAPAPKPEPTLINRTIPNYMCEKEPCPKKATTEWVQRDNDGGLYYTYRCEDHPADEQMIPQLLKMEA